MDGIGVNDISLIDFIRSAFPAENVDLYGCAVYGNRPDHAHLQETRMG